MKKFNVLIKDAGEDFITTENLWLTLSDKKDNYNFFKKYNKSELLLLLGNSTNVAPLQDSVISDSLSSAFEQFSSGNHPMHCFYINPQSNFFSISKSNGLIVILMNKNQKKIVKVSDIKKQPFNPGDCLIVFKQNGSETLPNDFLNKLISLEGFSHSILLQAQVEANSLGKNLIPLFCTEYVTHQSYEFPITSNLKTVALTIEMIKNKVLKYHTEKIWQIETVLHEALVNAITYGNEIDTSKQIIISYELCEKGLRVIIKDKGDGFDVRNISVPVGEEALERISGRGIYIMQQFSDALFYNEKGNEVILFFNF